MKDLLLIVASILALNLVIGLGMALTEYMRHRRVRREIAHLEAVWRLEPGQAARPRGSRLVGRTAIAVATMGVLSGVAVAAPGTRPLVEAMGEAVSRITDGSAGEAAEAPDGEGTPSDGATRETRRPDGRTGASASHAGGAQGASEDPRAGSDPRSPAAPEGDGSAPVDPAGPTETAATTPSPTTDPAPTEQPIVVLPPFTVTAEPTSATTADVSWTSVGEATEYAVERSFDGVTFDPVGTTVGGVTSMTITGLQPQTTYTVRVTAYMSTGDPLSDSSMVTTADAPASG